MNKKELNDDTRDKEIDHISAKMLFELDDICHEIFFTLMAYKRLRFNELHRYLKKFGTGISKPALIEHLNHLKKQKLITRKREEKQNVSYGLTDKIKASLDTSPEDIKEWFKTILDNKNLPERFKLIPIEEYYSKMTDSQIDQQTNDNLNDILANNLFELRTYVEYDLKIDKSESDKEFWNFIGNPMYRMLERSTVEKCRNNERYKIKLFEKINLLIEELRSDKDLLRERRVKQAEKLSKTKSEVS
jgi:DNA-binding HxlR family transcriptional regulator